MDVVQHLLDQGFHQVMVLDGHDCGIDEPTLLLAIMTYEAEETPLPGSAWIHPYYYASQRAYRIAHDLSVNPEAEPLGLRLRDEIRVKPIFARMPMLTQGRNTISYLPDVGSRFHVQIFTLDVALEPNITLLPEAKATHCGNCTRCMEACPTHAIDQDGFHRELCLRNWQLSGKPVPEALRHHMGSRLIGCDTCQRCCPHNPKPTGCSPTLPLASLITGIKEKSAMLKELIGANLALPNRVLSQAVILAGCSDDVSLLHALEPLRKHPSPVVAEHAEWACAQLTRKAQS